MPKEAVEEGEERTRSVIPHALEAALGGRT